MNGWTRTNSISVILAGIVIVGLLSGGIVCVLWTYPNDQGSLNDAVLQEWGQDPSGSWLALNSQGCSSCIDGPASVTIGPNSTAQYVVQFQTAIPAGTLANLHYAQSQDLYVFGPFDWKSPNSMFRDYAVFTYSFAFGTLGGPQPKYSTVWFTGPQGNLSQTVHTVKYGGTDLYHGGLFGTSIIEANFPGNYTLHYFNPLPPGPNSNLNGTVAMGPSSITFSTPYVYLGIVTTSIGVAVAVTTGFFVTKKLRRRVTTPP